MGKIVEESILDYGRGKFLGNIPHPSLITLLCIKGGVKFNEGEEERCPKVFPLTLAGVLKALVESEERERREKPTRKRKRVETAEHPREPAPTVVFEEGASSEERGDFEAYSEQPVLVPTKDQGTPTLTRVEERGKQKVATKERNTSELLSLLKEMKGEMRERDE